MVIQLFKSHLHLCLTTVELRNFADFEGFRIGAEDKKVATWTESCGSDRLDIAKSGKWRHIFDRLSVNWDWLIIFSGV